jgi:hypothetical protein
MKRLALAALACAALAQPALADPLAGYEPVDLTDYQPRESASAVMLLQDLFEGHPETVAEGRPVLKIDLRQNEDRSALLIDLEMTGYLDDSVDGREIPRHRGRGNEAHVPAGQAGQEDQMRPRQQCRAVDNRKLPVKSGLKNIETGI